MFTQRIRLESMNAYLFVFCIFCAFSGIAESKSSIIGIDISILNLTIAANSTTINACVDDVFLVSCSRASNTYDSDFNVTETDDFGERHIVPYHNWNDSFQNATFFARNNATGFKAYVCRQPVFTTSSYRLFESVQLRINYYNCSNGIWRNYKKKTGQDTTLYCVPGRKDENVTWQLDGMTLPEKNDYALTLSKLTEADTGIYRCVSEGERVSTYNLTVLNSTKAAQSVRIINVAGTSATLTWARHLEQVNRFGVRRMSSGHQPTCVHIEWRTDDGTYQERDIKVEDSDTITLRDLLPATFYDFQIKTGKVEDKNGRVSCEGEKSTKYFLITKPLPNDRFGSPTVIEAALDEEVGPLYCGAKLMYKQWYAEWFRDGAHLPYLAKWTDSNGQLKIESLSREDLGVYSCKMTIGYPDSRGMNISEWITQYNVTINETSINRSLPVPIDLEC